MQSNAQFLTREQFPEGAVPTVARPGVATAEQVAG